MPWGLGPVKIMSLLSVLRHHGQDLLVHHWCWFSGVNPREVGVDCFSKSNFNFWIINLSTLNLLRHDLFFWLSRYGVCVAYLLIDLNKVWFALKKKCLSYEGESRNNETDKCILFIWFGPLTEVKNFQSSSLLGQNLWIFMQSWDSLGLFCIMTKIEALRRSRLKDLNTLNWLFIHSLIIYLFVYLKM